MSRPYDAVVVDDVGVLSGVRDDDAEAMTDLRRNVLGAAAAGMTGVHHCDPDTTVAELEVLTGLPLRPV